VDDVLLGLYIRSGIYGGLQIMDELMFSKFFPRNMYDNWYYYIVNVIQDFPRVLKAKWQRSTRGWADCDVWSLDSWFQHVMPNMLRQLAENKMGIPMTVFTKEELALMELGEEVDDTNAAKRWDTILHTMAHRLEAHQRFWDNMDKYSELDTKAFMKKEDESIKEVDAGLEMFVKYFWSLWD
jgi:hypothetical protein